MHADGPLPPRAFGRALILAAHPDDETLAAGGSLRDLDPVAVVFVTDGAPRDPRLRAWDMEREEYAAIRRDEALTALSIAGVPADRLVHLGAIDQEAALDLPRITAAIRDRCAALAVDTIVGPAYEGGHPDHDATAFCAHAAAALLRREGRRAPLLVEAALYHGAGGVFTPGELLPYPASANANANASAPVTLTARQVAEKRAMIAAYQSQAVPLSRFRAEVERFRVAPAYDFSRTPHEGPLWYERLRWPMTGARLCALAEECRRALTLPAGPWA